MRGPNSRVQVSVPRWPHAQTHRPGRQLTGRRRAGSESSGRRAGSAEPCTRPGTRVPSWAPGGWSLLGLLIPSAAVHILEAIDCVSTVANLLAGRESGVDIPATSTRSRCLCDLGASSARTPEMGIRRAREVPRRRPGRRRCMPEAQLRALAPPTACCLGSTPDHRGCRHSGFVADGARGGRPEQGKEVPRSRRRGARRGEPGGCRITPNAVVRA